MNFICYEIYTEQKNGIILVPLVTSALTLCWKSRPGGINATPKYGRIVLGPEKMVLGSQEHRHGLTLSKSVLAALCKDRAALRWPRQLGVLQEFSFGQGLDDFKPPSQVEILRQHLWDLLFLDWLALGW